MKISPVFILSSVLLVACSSASSDEDAVRELFTRAEAAAEARDAGDVLELVADDYADAQGRTRADLRPALAAWFATHAHPELVTSIDELRFPVADYARARVTVRGLELDRFDFGETLVLDVELRREAGEWRITRADRARER